MNGMDTPILTTEEAIKIINESDNKICIETALVLMKGDEEVNKLDDFLTTNTKLKINIEDEFVRADMIFNDNGYEQEKIYYLLEDFKNRTNEFSLSKKDESEWKPSILFVVGERELINEGIFYFTNPIFYAIQPENINSNTSNVISLLFRKETISFMQENIDTARIEAGIMRESEGDGYEW